MFLRTRNVIKKCFQHINETPVGVSAILFTNKRSFHLTHARKCLALPPSNVILSHWKKPAIVQDDFSASYGVLYTKR